MTIRNGSEFIRRLSAHPRDIWVQGERVADVTTHPALSASVQQLAALYDMQVDPALTDELTYIVPETGERAGLAFQPAKSAADLSRRRNAFRLWAENNFGLMGRSPDFLNCTLLAFMEAKDVFERAGKRYGTNIESYYKYIRDNDLFLSHALVSPQNDRSKTSSDLANLHLRVVKETDAGINVSGARMIATLGAVSDEMLMYNLPMFKPGDEDHALVFSVPTHVEGLRQICRPPYVRAGSRTSFDHPLSSRFEENDSLLIFKNVFVPWERVYCYRDVAQSNNIYVDSALRNHSAHQTNTRALVKFQFVTGIAIALARSIKADQFLHVQEMLGECLNVVEIIKSGLIRSEVECEPTGSGTYRAALAPLQALRTFLPSAYPRVIEIVQKIAAGGFMLMPSGADFLAPDLRADAEAYYQGANINSLDRVRLFRLAWDIAGDSFGTRQLQYERYYAGDPIRTLASNYLSFKDGDATRLVNAALRLAGDP
jgi:anthranilate 3-monooxygenase (FAD) / 4-hydroxyphenylacetate 3-monooxygenase